ncbi:MAG: conjugal transfer protein TraF [Gammaproteobacteria bacterium]|nr:conjugal transfer protein TraF [Gammaproteobacteria bacterium]
MKKDSARLLMVLGFFLGSSVCTASFFEEHQEGWFWYESLEPPPKPKVKPPSPSIESFLRLNPTEAMQAYQAKIQDSLNLAILHPTEANLKAYARYYFQTMNRAQTFTDAYQRMLLNHPVFDYSLDFPISTPAHQVYLKNQKRHEQKMIQDFAKHQGLFFFFSSHCEYCKVFAPIVKAFAEQYGVSILAISMDGQGLAEFPQFLPDNGASQALKVQRLPSLLAINPKTNVVTVLATGAISQTQLEENILRFLKTIDTQEVIHE